MRRGLKDDVRTEEDARKEICFTIVDEVIAGLWDHHLFPDDDMHNPEPLRQAFRQRAGFGWASSQLMASATIQGRIKQRSAMQQIKSDVERLLARYKD